MCVATSVLCSAATLVLFGVGTACTHSWQRHAKLAAPTDGLAKVDCFTCARAPLLMGLIVFVHAALFLVVLDGSPEPASTAKRPRITPDHANAEA